MPQTMVRLRLSTTSAYETWKVDVGTATTQIRPPGSFPLLCLPFDVRLAIYEAAFTTEQKLLIHYRCIEKDPPPPINININFLRVCKTVYVEALPIIYTRNKFIMPRIWENYLARLSGEGLTMLSNLELVVEYGLRQIFLWKDATNTWKKILHQCHGLKEVTLNFDKMKDVTTRDFWAACMVIAYKIAVAAQKTATPRFTVTAKLVDIGMPTYQVFCLEELLADNENERMREKYSNENPLELPRSGTLRFTGLLATHELPYIEQFRQNGWRFKIILTEISAASESAAGGSDVPPCGHVQLIWMKESFQGTIESVAGQERNR